jgi:phosphoribosylformimino-5-aminoimidazole carboxamide ribonucleotide (ProFAR) isomerase
MSELRAMDLARQVEDAGAGTIIYTDIATDGMLAGELYGNRKDAAGAGAAS